MVGTIRYEDDICVIPEADHEKEISRLNLALKMSKATSDKLREALKYYAVESNYIRMADCFNQGEVARKALENKDEPLDDPDITKCPECGGEADNGHDRCVPPNPYVCTMCEEKK